MSSFAVESSRPGEHKRPRGMSLHLKILLGLFFGAAFGIGANWYFQVPDNPELAKVVDVNADGINDRLDTAIKTVIEPLGRVFLRLVLMVVLPLVFSALVCGVVGLGDIGRLGRVGLRSLFFTVIFSVAAVAIGLTAVNLIQPGSGLTEEKRESLRAAYSKDASSTVEKAKQAKPIHQILLDMLPENPLQEAAGALDGSSKGNGILAVMCFALIFGVALALCEPAQRDPLVAFFETIFAVAMKIIGFAMLLAPYGVACLTFSITARLGSEILWTLAWFILTVLIALSIQMFVVYPLALWFFARRNPIQFFKDGQDAIMTAFGTSSSNATLPTALRVAQENLKLPKDISRFVLTVGATANQNGTALYEGVVVLFLAQVFGVQLDISQQITVVLMSVLAGIGTAGVPGGSIPMIVVVLQSVGVPPDGIAIILGVDRILDMCRTTLNVFGDLTMATCVSAGMEPSSTVATARD